MGRLRTPEGLLYLKWCRLFLFTGSFASAQIKAQRFTFDPYLALELPSKILIVHNVTGTAVERRSALRNNISDHYETLLTSRFILLTKSCIKFRTRDDLTLLAIHPEQIRSSPLFRHEGATINSWIPATEPHSQALGGKSIPAKIFVIGSLWTSLERLDAILSPTLSIMMTIAPITSLDFLSVCLRTLSPTVRLPHMLVHCYRPLSQGRIDLNCTARPKNRRHWVRISKWVSWLTSRAPAHVKASACSSLLR